MGFSIAEWVFWCIPNCAVTKSQHWECAWEKTGPGFSLLVFPYWLKILCETFCHCTNWLNPYFNNRSNLVDAYLENSSFNNSNFADDRQIYISISPNSQIQTTFVYFLRKGRQYPVWSIKVKEHKMLESRCTHFQNTGTGFKNTKWFWAQMPLWSAAASWSTQTT